jgi:hypothetical protein
MIFLEQDEPNLGLSEEDLVRCNAVLIEFIDAQSTGRAGVPKPQSCRVDNTCKFVYPGTIFVWFMLQVVRLLFVTRVRLVALFA